MTAATNDQLEHIILVYDTAERFILSSIVHSVDCTTENQIRRIGARAGRILLLYSSSPTAGVHKDNRREIEAAWTCTPEFLAIYLCLLFSKW